MTSNHTTRRKTGRRVAMTILAAALLAAGTGCGTSELAPPTRQIAFGSSTCAKDDPFEAGKTAAQAAKDQLDGAPPKAVLITE